jgi:hypothetical protein
MIRHIKKIIFFLSLFLLYFIVKEFIGLYVLLQDVHPYAAYGFILLSAAALVYFVAIPAYRIIAMPSGYAPVRSEEGIDKVIAKRMEALHENTHLKETGYDFSAVTDDRLRFEQAMSVLNVRCAEIRKKYVNQLFYSTAIVQNGFIDAILILSASVNLTRETFILYNGRVSYKDMLNIGKQVYYSMAIGGSEITEYATSEILSKLSTETMRGIPFLDKILSSLADGFVNACLLTRVSLITQNYCSKLIIRSNRELYPDPRFIVQTAENITGTLFNNVIKLIKKTTKKQWEKAYEKLAINPAKYIIDKARHLTGKESEEIDTFIDDGEYEPRTGWGKMWEALGVGKRGRN